MEKISLPKIFEKKVSDVCSIITIEPLFPGYGHTLGNALRRVLLASIPGAAITSFKIEGAPHEFTSLPHIKEDLVEIMMNLKGVNIKSFSDSPVKITLSKKGPAEVTAADFSKNSEVEIFNLDQTIATLDKKADFVMEVIIENNRGFRSSDEVKANSEIGNILVDAAFSPVERVKLEVQNTRVGQMTNYDKLILDISTNGSISPHQAVVEASNILIEHYKVFAFNELSEVVHVIESATDEIINTETEPDIENDQSENHNPKTKIEESGLSPRTANALINAGIKTIAGLQRLSELKLSEIKGLGKKGIDEIKSVKKYNENT